ncbi:MAG: hypothetical protein HKP10_07435 [Kiritimatiellales bacterium]|nr:hypothetical protein [Kiritimatiellales bacterium]
MKKMMSIVAVALFVMGMTGCCALKKGAACCGSCGGGEAKAECCGTGGECCK